ncbi:hypothetical protein SAMN05216556_12625 [Aequorivita viscosa]|nr:hypothetical protein SAMN05216556_12625 [Aequorivita viscosa]
MNPLFVIPTKEESHTPKTQASIKNPKTHSYAISPAGRNDKLKTQKLNVNESPFCHSDEGGIPST